jgi:hypothetical protein
MHTPAATPPRIVAIGETLWDLLPDGGVWGGAPGNAACHAAGLGAAGVIVSRVGRDDLVDRCGRVGDPFPKSRQGEGIGEFDHQRGARHESKVLTLSSP